jgi:hypothetical protein
MDDIVAIGIDAKDSNTDSNEDQITTFMDWIEKYSLILSTSNDGFQKVLTHGTISRANA